MKDLIVLTADQNMEFLMKGLLPRLPQVWGIQPFTFDIRRHPLRDPGCLRESHDFLRPFTQTYERCIVMLDRMGCGKEQLSREDLETEIEELLAKNGWNDRQAALVLDPELENWTWIPSPHVARAVNWSDIDALYAWLKKAGHLPDKQLKPGDPKKALEEALKKSKTPRSSAIYQKIAATASFKSCQDPCFHKLKARLHDWYGPSTS